MVRHPGRSLTTRKKPNGKPRRSANATVAAPLLDAANLDALATELRPSSPQILHGLRAIEQLRRRRDDGSLAALSETQIEQSFNERLFAEVFDYRTLLRDGDGEYHFKVKKRRQIANGVRVDDFSLGTFGTDIEMASVTGELKGPGLLSNRAVAQGHKAAAHDASVQWVVLSDFDELRLYRKGDLTRATIAHLSRIETARDFIHLWAVFSRRSLVPPAGGRSLLEDAVMGNLLVFGPLSGKYRLVHEAVLTTMGTEHEPIALLRRLDTAVHDCLRQSSALFDDPLAGRRALGRQWPSPGLCNSTAVLDGDRLRRATEDLQRGGARSTFDANRRGSLRCTEHIEGPTIEALDIVERLVKFVGVAVGVVRAAFPEGLQTIRFSWRLYDLAQPGERTRLDLTRLAAWAEEPTMPFATVQPGVEGAGFESAGVHVSAVPSINPVRQRLEAILHDAMSELCFPFVSQMSERRARPRDGDIARIATPIFDALEL